jgi:hypothetical protein
MFSLEEVVTFQAGLGELVEGFLYHLTGVPLTDDLTTAAGPGAELLIMTVKNGNRVLPRLAGLWVEIDPVRLAAVLEVETGET